jgi:HPt (histidine-containing phosphotransfer) domain-containing protein
MDAEPQFDIAAIDMLRRLGRDSLAAKMIGLFLASVGERRTGILGAAEQADLAGAQRYAHLLKSSAGQMGARSLQRLCERIEAAARDGQPAEVRSLSTKLEAECRAAEDWLRTTNASLTPDLQ